MIYLSERNDSSSDEAGGICIEQAVIKAAIWSEGRRQIFVRAHSRLPISYPGSAVENSFKQVKQFLHRLLKVFSVVISVKDY